MSAEVIAAAYLRANLNDKIAPRASSSSSSASSMATATPSTLFSSHIETTRSPAKSVAAAPSASTMASSSDAASTYSYSTTYSYDKGVGDSHDSSKPKRSVTDRLKSVWGDMGYPPTRRYDIKMGGNGAAKPSVGPMGSNPGGDVRNPPRI